MPICWSPPQVLVTRDKRIRVVNIQIYKQKCSAYGKWKRTCPCHLFSIQNQAGEDPCRTYAIFLDFYPEGVSSNFLHPLLPSFAQEWGRVIWGGGVKLQELKMSAGSRLTKQVVNTLSEYGLYPKDSQNHISILAVLFCTLNSKIAWTKGFYFVSFVRIKRDPPVFVHLDRISPSSLIWQLAEIHNQSSLLSEGKLAVPIG